MKKNQIKNFHGADEMFQSLLKQAADHLKKTIGYSFPQSSSITHWDQLIDAWSKDKDLPLYIRKSNEKYPRGKIIKHNSGRILIPADNGPAHWSICMCMNENSPSLAEIREIVADDRIPIAMILKSSEKTSDFKCTMNEIDDATGKGWKIAHKKEIGLNSRQPLETTPIHLLEEHFRKFMSPKNMFLFPKEFSGLAEVQAFIEIFS